MFLYTTPQISPFGLVISHCFCQYCALWPPRAISSIVRFWKFTKIYCAGAPIVQWEVHATFRIPSSMQCSIIGRESFWVGDLVSPSNRNFFCIKLSSSLNRRLFGDDAGDGGFVEGYFIFVSLEVQIARPVTSWSAFLWSHFSKCNACGLGFWPTCNSGINNQL